VRMRRAEIGRIEDGVKAGRRAAGPADPAKTSLDSKGRAIHCHPARALRATKAGTQRTRRRTRRKTGLARMRIDATARKWTWATRRVARSAATASPSLAPAGRGGRSGRGQPTSYPRPRFAAQAPRGRVSRSPLRALCSPLRPLRSSLQGLGAGPLYLRG
jgi:hypothetical protein